jgi:1-acyl-sn-glycerol-3-phosphate acyltransferase
MPSPRESLIGLFEFFVRPPSKFVTNRYFDLKVEGLENVPKSGAVVLASNHFSHLDPPLIAVHTGRYVRFMAVDQLFGKSRIFDAAMSFYGAIPLDRDGYPIRAMREAIGHLDGGNAVGLFPEGRRVERWGVDDPKRGAAWLAWMTGAPLIPVAIHGTQHSMAPLDMSFRRTAVHLWYEEPLWWFDYAQEVDPVTAMTKDWFEAVDGRLSTWADG